MQQDSWFEAAKKLQPKFESVPTETLRELIRGDRQGVYELDLVLVMAVCGVLAKREPPKRSAQESWEDFQRKYLDGPDKSDK